MGRLWTGQIGLSGAKAPTLIGPYIEWDTRIGGRTRWRETSGATTGWVPDSGYLEGYVMLNSGSSQGAPGLNGAQPDDLIGDGQQHIFDCYTEDGYPAHDSGGAGAAGIINGTQNEWYIHWAGGSWNIWGPLGGSDESLGWTWVAALNNVSPDHDFADCMLYLWAGSDQVLLMEAYVEPGEANCALMLTREWSGRANENNNYAAFTPPTLSNCTFVVASRFFNGPGSVTPDVPLPEHRNAWMIYGAGPTIVSLHDAAYVDYLETHDHYANSTPFVGANTTRLDAYMNITSDYPDSAIGQYPSGSSGNPNPSGRWTEGFWAGALYRGFPTTADLIALHNYYQPGSIPPRPFPPGVSSAALLRAASRGVPATVTGSTVIERDRPPRPPGAP